MDAVKGFLSNWASGLGGWFGKLFGGSVQSGIATSLTGSGAAAGVGGTGAAGGGIFGGITSAGVASAAAVAAAFAVPLLITWAGQSPGEAATEWVETWTAKNPEVRQLAIEAGNSVDLVTAAWDGVQAAQGTTLEHAVRMTRLMDHLAGEMGDAWSHAMELAASESVESLALVQEQSEVTVDTIAENYGRLPETMRRSMFDPLTSLGNMLDNVFRPRTVEVDFTVDDRGYRSGIKNLPNYDYGGSQQHGGAYQVTKPTLFLAGEAGPEEAVFSGANRSLAGGPIGVPGAAHRGASAGHRLGHDQREAQPRWGRSDGGDDQALSAHPRPTRLDAVGEGCADSPGEHLLRGGHGPHTRRGHRRAALGDGQRGHREHHGPRGRAGAGGATAHHRRRYNLDARGPRRGRPSHLHRRPEPSPWSRRRPRRPSSASTASRPRSGPTRSKLSSA